MGAYKAKKKEEGPVVEETEAQSAPTAKRSRKQTSEKVPRKRQSNGTTSENPAKRERRTKASKTSAQASSSVTRSLQRLDKLDMKRSSKTLLQGQMLSQQAVLLKHCSKPWKPRLVW